MKEISIKKAAEYIGGRLIGTDDIYISSVCTDTRNITKGCLFVALEGENFDGHNYVNEAICSGAACIMAHKEIEVGDTPVLYVENTGKAFISLAGYYRTTLNIKVIGVTGSVGKTTTKDFIACVMEMGYKTHKSKGNENNEVGLPKTLFAMEDDCTAVVLEMGMCGFGEIEELTLAAKPDIGVITNIGVSHMELLGSRENILKAKMEIRDGMKDKSPLIICGDNDLLSNVSDPRLNIVKYGIENTDNYIRGKFVLESECSTEFTVELDGKEYNAQIPTIGNHNVLNALCAIAVGINMGISAENAIIALKKYSPSGMRQNIVSIGEIIVVEDCYNASPDSVNAALTTLGNYNTKGRRIAVLGDMLELGEISVEAHKDSGRLAYKNKVDLLFALGVQSEYTVKSAIDYGVNAIHFSTKEELSKALLKEVKNGDVIWVKGSRGMKLEDVLQELYIGLKA